MIELGVLTQDGDDPEPAAPPLDRRLLRRLAAAAVSVLTLLTATGSRPPGPPFVRPLWSVPFREGDTMAVDDTTVYVTQLAKLSAYDLATGRPRWSVPAGDADSSGQPAAAGVLLIAVGQADVQFSQPDGSFVHSTQTTGTLARDAATGRALWTTGGVALQTFDTSALLGEMDGRGRVTGLRVVGLRDGVTRWTRTVARADAWTVARAGNRPDQIVLCDATGRLTVLRYADGATVRTGQVSPDGPAPPDDSFLATVDVIGDRLVLSRASKAVNASTVYRLDTLRELWHTDGFVADCAALLCTIDNVGVTGHDPATGAVRWHRSDLGGYFARAGDHLLASGSSTLGPWRVVDVATGRDIGAAVPGQPTWVGADLPQRVLLIGTVLENARLNSVIQLDLATGASYLLGAIPQTAVFGCQSALNYLVCGGSNQLAVTAVG